MGHLGKNLAPAWDAQCWGCAVGGVSGALLVCSG